VEQGESNKKDYVLSSASRGGSVPEGAGRTLIYRTARRRNCSSTYQLGKFFFEIELQIFQD
jgi:hypothetical protein